MLNTAKNSERCFFLNYVSSFFFNFLFFLRYFARLYKMDCGFSFVLFFPLAVLIFYTFLCGLNEAFNFYDIVLFSARVLSIIFSFCFLFYFFPFFICFLFFFFLVVLHFLKAGFCSCEAIGTYHNII